MMSTSALSSNAGKTMNANQHNQLEAISGMPIENFATQRRIPTKLELTEERLPFTVRIVSCEEDLDKAVSVRHTAYARHLPTVAALLTTPEAYDRDEGSVVVLAESKLDGSPLGTMRIQTNRCRPLALEQSLALPVWLQGKSLAEATRLGVSQGGIGPVVKTALFKAYFHYCQLADIEWMVIAARAPLDRQYEALLFKDVYPSGEYIPMRHAGNIPHRVLAFDVAAAEQNWAKAKHPLFNYIFRTQHRDIDVTGEDVRVLASQGIDFRVVSV
jgi:hypothetical protein